MRENGIWPLFTALPALLARQYQPLVISYVIDAEHGDTSGIRDAGVLDPALNRAPQRHAYDKDATLFQLAACYGYGLATNHPFVDRNKRVALTVAGMFLELNGYSLDAPEPETVIVIEQMATGKREEQALADWLEESSIPIA